MEPVTTLVGLKTENHSNSSINDECEITAKEAEWIERDCRIDRTIDSVISSVAARYSHHPTAVTSM